MSTSENYLAGIGRIGIAILFLFSGLHHAIDHDGTVQKIAAAGLPSSQAFFWVMISIELVGGAALALGLLRPVAALVLAVYTLLSAAVFYTKFGDATLGQFMENDQFVHILKNIAIAGGLLQVFCYSRR